MKEVMKIRQISVDGTIINTDNITPKQALIFLHKHKPFKKATVFALDGWHWDYTMRNNRIVRK